MIPPTRNIGAGSTTLSTTDNILNIDTTIGAATVTLPSITEWFILKNKSGSIYDTDGLRFTDIGGDSATNNITFLPSLTDQINGASSMVVNTNGASGVITPTLDGSGSGINSWEFSLTGATGGGTGFVIPMEYDLTNFTNLAYELNITPMGNSLLGVNLHSVSVKSFSMPENNVIPTITFSTVVLTEDFNLDIAQYSNLQTFQIHSFLGINLLNIESSIMLQSLSLVGVISNLAGDGFIIESLSGITTLTDIMIGTQTKLTSIGNISNLPDFSQITINDNSSILTIGDISFNPSLISDFSINNNSSLLSIGSLAGNTINTDMSISNSPSLTIIGSLASNPALLNVTLTLNALDSTTVSQVLIDLDVNGLSDGTLDVSGGTNAGLASLTAGGTTAYNNLLGKTWTITINS